MSVLGRRRTLRGSELLVGGGERGGETMDLALQLDLLIQHHPELLLHGAQLVCNKRGQGGSERLGAVPTNLETGV